MLTCASEGDVGQITEGGTLSRMPCSCHRFCAAVRVWGFRSSNPVSSSMGSWHLSISICERHCYMNSPSQLNCLCG